MTDVNTRAFHLRRNVRPDSRRAGLTLLEVTIALGILGFGVLAAAATQLTAIRYNQQSHLRTEAGYLAEQQMEAFQSMDGAAVEVIRTLGTYPNDTGNPIDPDPNDNSTQSFNRSWTITPDTPEDGIYTLAVNVSWTDSLGFSRSVTLNSLKMD